MSNLTLKCEQNCKVLASTGKVNLIVAAKEKELGGFSVRRVLPSVQRKMVGPWIFFDHMGPAHFAPGEGVNVRPHPHIGLATVTYLFAGEMLHRDSVGSCQLIRPGDINLMVAGKGIVHSERERPEQTRVDRIIHGLQLWLALPEGQEDIEPAFYHYAKADIPETRIEGVLVRVMMGRAYGLISPVKTHSETLYLEAHLLADQMLTLPDAEERAVYVAEGSLTVGETVIPAHSMAFFESGSEVQIQTDRETRIALVGGERFNPRFIEWNFVSSRKERIGQAKQDWQQGRFAKVPGDEDEFIPLPG
jgi:redox-sensitive bicupin YhaK (pirin superfamily)